MKKSILAASMVLFLVSESACQVIGYYLPEKKLRITVTYNLKGYVLKGLAGDGGGEILDRKFEMMISDDIKIEEVIVPDGNRHFEISIPKQLSKWGARFGWGLKLDRNGILIGWNASREPVVAAVISGGIGFVANILTGMTPVLGAMPGLKETSYKVVTDQKITVTEIVDIPADGISGKVVAKPQLDTSVTNAIEAMPSVSITINDAGIGMDASQNESTGGKDVLYYIVPKHYRLQVNINQNGLMEKGQVVDYMLIVPQHGQLKHIAVSELFKGRKSATVSLDPSTGQLLTWKYGRDGNTKADLTGINTQLESLAEAIGTLRTVQDQKLKEEVTRLELEVKKLELLQELRE